jgi:hypothetical protein
VCFAEGCRCRVEREGGVAASHSSRLVGLLLCAALLSVLCCCSQWQALL